MSRARYVPTFGRVPRRGERGAPDGAPRKGQPTRGVTPPMARTSRALTALTVTGVLALSGAGAAFACGGNGTGTAGTSTGTQTTSGTTAADYPGSSSGTSTSTGTTD